MTAEEDSEPTAQAQYVTVVSRGQLSVPCSDGAPKSRGKAVYGSPKIPTMNSAFRAEATALCRDLQK